MDDVNYYLGLHPLGAVAIVVSTTLLYLAFVVFLRASSQRLFSSPSSFELAVATVLGAVVGRAILGQVPTLAGGLLALGTLFLLEKLSGKVSRRMAAGADRRHRAVAIMTAGKVERELMRRYGIDDVSLWRALRAAGVRGPQEVALVVLEQNGAITVLRADAPVHAAALTGVRRSDHVMDRLVGAGLARRGSGGEHGRGASTEVRE